MFIQIKNWQAIERQTELKRSVPSNANLMKESKRSIIALQPKVEAQLPASKEEAQPPKDANAKNNALLQGPTTETDPVKKNSLVSS